MARASDDNAKTIEKALALARDEKKTPEEIAKRLRLKKPTLLARMRRGGFEYYTPTGYWVRKGETPGEAGQ